ncbi:MAG TPA: choice-of-anchor J domain-containing protein [Chitinivibrionales bacterium]|nr:choice-of-anchor J domain-containing protein [Chitinivibrionales bacterium]
MRTRCSVFALLLSYCLVHAGSATLLSENFEGAAAGWTLTGDWQIGTPSVVGPVTVPQGTRCAATNISGYYSANSASALTTPLIQLPSTATQITLSFFEWYYTESCCDFMYLELSTNGGVSWNTLRSALSGSNQVWTQRTFDLTSYKNNSVQIRFRFTADGSDNYPGWYVDSVSIVATVIDTTNLPHIAVAPGSFKIGPGDSPTQTLTICNTGIRDTLQYSFGTSNPGPVNIVAWTYGADMSYSYPNLVSSLRSRIPSANITPTATTDPTTLGALLQNAQVFLIPAQEYAMPPYTYGMAFASVLNTFVRSGGIVIAIGPSTMSSFLSYAGLDTISSYSSTSSGAVSVLNPSHPIFDSVTAGSLTMLYMTYYWSSLGSATVLATYNSYPVCSERKKGGGFVYLLGYDFYYVNTTTWGRILANCITKNLSSLGNLVTVDTIAGSIKAGSCKNATLTFHRERMTPGTQVVTVRIQHNALLDVNPVSVACTLLVDSTTMLYRAPSMAVPAFTGDTAERDITIQNTGSSLLNFSVVKTSTGVTVPSILINEVGIYYRFIELLNVGATDVNIGGWRLAWTDNSGTTGSFTVPANIAIKSHRFVIAYASTGISNDSLQYIGSILGWTSTTDLSVSLLNASGQGVDFFKISLDPSAPPAGTTWLGAGYVRSGSMYYYYRMSTIDNNTAADWTSTSNASGYYWFTLNPGQSFSSGATPPGYISARADSLSIAGGSSALIRFRYDATSLLTSGVFIDTFQIAHNAKNLPSPITVICTLTVTSNIPVLIPYQPDPTINRKPLLQWHPVASASAYIIEIAQTSSFTTLQVIQQTQDTSFQPLVPLPLGDIFWRVRSDVNTRPSLPDHFFIQNDSIPVLIPLQPDTIVSQAGTMFTWYHSAGATSYRIQIYKTDSVVPQPVVITFTTDTFYRQAVPLQSGRYVWMVSANFDYTRLSYPDTFWVKSPTGIPSEIQSKHPLVFALRTYSSAGRLIISCAIPQYAAQALRPVAVDLFDVRGRLVGKVFDGMLAAGYYQFVVPEEHLASGMYLCRMRSVNEQKLTPVFMKK